MLRRPDLCLLPSALAVWVIAAIGIAAGVQMALTACAVILALVLLIAVLGARPALRHALLAHGALLLVLVTALLPALDGHHRTVDALADAAARGARVQLRIQTTHDPDVPADAPAWSQGQLRTMARVLPGPARLGTQETTLPAGVQVLLTGPAEDLESVHAGDTLLVRARVSTSEDLVILTPSEVQLLRPENALRTRFRDGARTATAHLPADEAALARGFTTGDTAGLAAHSEEIMQRAGISHLVAVSGANIALVLAAVLGPLLLLGVPRRPRIALAAVVGTGYVLLVGPEPSVLRAATMAAPLLLARFIGVRASPVGALALTLAVWSIRSPATAASIGFVLSALATVSILVLSRPVAARLRSASGDRLPGPAALVLAVPLVAQVVCTPVLIVLSPEVSAWSVLVNVLVGPLVGPATVLGIGAVAIAPALPTLASALFTPVGGAAHLVLLIAAAADALPGSRIPVPGGVTGALACAAVILLLAVGLLAVRTRRILRWALAVVVVLALAVPVSRNLPVGPASDWRITMCAVGQGDAVLLRAEDADGDGSRTVLIDTGPDPEPLTACLDRVGVGSIDLLILTHPHADHVGGRAALVGSRTPARQWICPLPEAAALTATGPPAEVVSQGTSLALGSLDLDVLWPPADPELIRRTQAQEEGGGEDDAGNDCSVVLSATWPDGQRYLGLGDIEPAAQGLLLESHPGPADVIKIAHHGSRRQDQALYQEMSPSIALVTAGQDNSFGHPTPAALNMLRLLGATALRTDRDGTVVLAPGTEAAPRSVGPGR